MAKLPKTKVNEEAKNIEKEGGAAVTDLEKKIFDLPSFKKDGAREGLQHKNPYVVLKYFQKDWECFSAWTKDELGQFSNFLATLGGHTWDSVYKSGGKGGNKAGLGYTQYKVEEMKAGGSHVKRVLEKLSPEINLIELRVSQKMRVHGFQSQSAFFMILLDREHKVFPK
ncbi:hypothetical protein [Pseudomonas sp. RGM2987]|uniref:hypothetical protein n=1 Tax=Pseudomonas sp. RGM2987 TaxID=2930090 RepID=UPI001FD6D8A6|nr:hypothetical protein [Pseudomonas sp. RGM2987]MCJ8205737.1 hypothetical protein [Pseudomonas sp. RGM2987]